MVAVRLFAVWQADLAYNRHTAVRRSFCVLANLLPDILTVNIVARKNIKLRAGEPQRYVRNFF